MAGCARADGIIHINVAAEQSGRGGSERGRRTVLLLGSITGNGERASYAPSGALYTIVYIRDALLDLPTSEPAYVEYALNASIRLQYRSEYLY